ncbi:uncharacterized protein NPIL_459271 [Nephila pilipes]|uniref:Uncharacterized protein n=1 Tax=Nephila pilipes TaxID=299642 RepID=A0A8X6R3C6_NEPPI|nr:uncharacterized protein NPIL_459271 [Nephila pilipes]
MKSFIKYLIFLVLFFSVVAYEKTDGTNAGNNTDLRRSGRRNYGSYPAAPSRNYGSIGEYKDDSVEDSEPTPYESFQGGDYPNFNEYKGYDQYINNGKHSFLQNNIGYPPSYSSWGSPAQMMQMMMVLKNMGDVAKPEETGLFSKLMSDPNIAAAAFIPLSIAAAAAIPVLMNFLMGGTSTPMVSTTANSREFRRFDATKNIEVLVENIAMLARAVDNDECIQKTICRIARGESNIPVSNYVKSAASTIAHMIKDDWLDNLRIKNLVDAVKQDNCENVCSSYVITPRMW